MRKRKGKAKREEKEECLEEMSGKNEVKIGDRTFSPMTGSFALVRGIVKKGEE